MKDNLQLLKNRAFRIISGAKYDVGSKDILKNLKLDLLGVRRKKLKSIFLCIYVPQWEFGAVFEGLWQDYGYDLLCVSETGLKLTKPQTNF